MVKGSVFEDTEISETGNWNVADKFTKVKIMLPMAKCEFYEDLAQFGYESFIDDLVSWYQIPQDIIRIKGLTRLIKELLRICQNTKFAMIKGSSKKDLTDIEEKLQEINDIIPALYKITHNQIQKTRTLTIIPKKFDPILKKVIQIKSDMNVPLNKNDLIFVNKEVFDAKKYKLNLLERMKNKG